MQRASSMLGFGTKGQALRSIIVSQEMAFVMIAHWTLNWKKNMVLISNNM
jgi:hypothetical protein